MNLWRLLCPSSQLEDTLSRLEFAFSRALSPCTERACAVTSTSREEEERAGERRHQTHNDETHSGPCELVELGSSSVLSSCLEARASGFLLFGIMGRSVPGACVDSRLLRSWPFRFSRFRLTI